jgi:hypothetical protein
MRVGHPTKACSDRLQRPLVPRSRFRRRLIASARRQDQMAVSLSGFCRVRDVVETAAPPYLAVRLHKT